MCSAPGACERRLDHGGRHWRSPQSRERLATQVGNAHFAWFGTTRIVDFAAISSNCCAPAHGDYVINAEALAYMRQRALAGPLIACLAEHPDHDFLRRSGRLDRPSRPARHRGSQSQPGPGADRDRRAPCGAASRRMAFWLNTVIVVSDDAGQFNVGQHGLCWSPCRAPRSTSSTPSPTSSAPPSAAGALIWRFSTAILKAYRQHPSPAPQGRFLRARFDPLHAARPASSPSTAYSHGSWPTRANC